MGARGQDIAVPLVIGTLALDVVELVVQIALEFIRIVWLAGWLAGPYDERNDA